MSGVVVFRPFPVRHQSSTTRHLDGLSDQAVFTYSHDVLGRKTMVTAKVGSTDDYVNWTLTRTVQSKNPSCLYNPFRVDAVGGWPVTQGGARRLRRLADPGLCCRTALRFKGNSDQSRIFVHDAGQIVLDLEKTGTGDAANGDLSHRYLWGTAVDQILADEAVDYCLNGEFGGSFDDIHVGDFVGVRYYPDRQQEDVLVPHTIRITRPVPGK